MSTTITTITELQAIEDDLAGDYILGNDIEGSGTNFTPIGSSSPYFTGTLDGAGYVIKNLTITINTSGSQSGALIGRNYGIIKNLGLVDCAISVTSTDSGASGAALAIQNWGSIPHCYSTGTITVVGYRPGIVASGAGGLVLLNWTGGEICDSYSTVTVSVNGRDAEAGGFVDWNYGYIGRCYATGNVTTDGKLRAQSGGFVAENYTDGTNAGEIEDCYSRGNASATHDDAGYYCRAGGFIAYNVTGAVGATVENCYSTGTTTSDITEGGFCALNDSTITACFWDTETSSDATSDGGTGKTTALMKTKTTFTDADWNFISIWSILSTVNSGYPYLLSIARPPYTTPPIYDDHGRPAKGARIEARRNDTGHVVETQTLDANGKATFTELPNDVGVTFYTTWGGSSSNNKSELLYSTIIGVSEGGTGSSDASTARTNLGLAIGTNVQAWDGDLDDIAALTPTDSNILVGDGTDWVKESGATARTSLGVGTTDSPQFTGVNVGHASDTTIARAAAGRATIESVAIVRGPASATDNRLAKFNLTTGDLIQQTGITADDSNNVSGVAKLTTSSDVELGHATDTTVHRESAGKVSIEGTVIVRPANYVVAANGAPTHVKAQADYVCDGTDDHVQILAAIDALPATGGKVLLTEGTFTNEAAIVLDSYQTLQGMGRNTILTTTTGGLNIITATGSSGSEKVGIKISDLQVDGGATKIGKIGIYLEYVDNSLIQDVYAQRFHGALGFAGEAIYIYYSDHNIITNCITEDNEGSGLALFDSAGNIITGNISSASKYGITVYDSTNNCVASNVCIENSYYGMCVYGDNNAFISNVCNENSDDSSRGDGFNVAGSYCTFLGNICRKNGVYGIVLASSNHNVIEGNNVLENSQITTNTYDNIALSASDYNLIQGNICRAGAETNKPRYGINIVGATCDGNKVINNDLYDDGFGTGAFNDAGTGTIYVEPGIDDTPVNGETGQPISSNWAYDHNAVFEAHASRHGYLGADELLSIMRLLSQRAIPFLYKAWQDINGFTAAHTGSGGFTTGWSYAPLYTGVTNDSEGIIYDSGGFYQAYASYGYSWGMTVSIRQTSTQTIWIGLLDVPTAPSLTQPHIAFYVDTSNNIWASSGNGTSGTQTDTGLNHTNTNPLHLSIYGNATGLYFYINHVLKATHLLASSYYPNALSCQFTMYIKNATDAATREMYCYPLNMFAMFAY